MSQLRSCASHRETGLNRISGYHGLNVIYCRFLSFSKLQGYREVILLLKVQGMLTVYRYR